ncbi:hypothetical protein SAT01_38060 [Sinomonas atrocyanea]|nr:hypothetical protein SAT01_38060 [Sinomonas atrocyanea]GGG70091.1 hypothetical protein GCM10007172_22860 [Sinomonas atrocyanea]
MTGNARPAELKRPRKRALVQTSAGTADAQLGRGIKLPVLLRARAAVRVQRPSAGDGRRRSVGAATASRALRERVERPEDLL